MGFESGLKLTRSAAVTRNDHPIIKHIAQEAFAKVPPNDRSKTHQSTSAEDIYGEEGNGHEELVQCGKSLSILRGISLFEKITKGSALRGHLPSKWSALS